MTLEEMEAKVHRRADGCWIWCGSRARGYGYVKRELYPGFGLTCVPAHREVWRLLRGPIPEGILLDHLCRSRACVNPDHLDPVTPQENLLRSPRTLAAQQIARTHCPQGHEYSRENTMGWRGMRFCRTCHKERCRNYNRRRTEERRRIKEELALQAEPST